MFLYVAFFYLWGISFVIAFWSLHYVGSIVLAALCWQHCDDSIVMVAWWCQCCPSCILWQHCNSIVVMTELWWHCWAKSRQCVDGSRLQQHCAAALCCSIVSQLCDCSIVQQNCCCSVVCVTSLQWHHLVIQERLLKASIPAFSCWSDMNTTTITAMQLQCCSSDGSFVCVIMM